VTGFGGSREVPAGPSGKGKLGIEELKTMVSELCYEQAKHVEQYLHRVTFRKITECFMRFVAHPVNKVSYIVLDGSACVLSQRPRTSEKTEIMQ
jgi:hypothetical protein